MITYAQVPRIVDRIMDSLGLPDDLYLTWDREAANQFRSEYLTDTEYLWDNVAQALADYDVSDMSDEELEDIRMDIYEDACSRLDDLLNNFEKHQSENTFTVLQDIFWAIRGISGVVDVDTEYEPADYEYGIRESRTAKIKLDNGAEINLEITVDEDYL